MTRIVKQEWLVYPAIKSPEQEEVVRELMSYHVLCPTCCLLDTDPYTGHVQEVLPNSALHWSRVWEWPWAILNGEIGDGKGVSDILDAAGGHGPFQYVLAARSGAIVTNIDHNRESLQAVDKMSIRVKCGGRSWETQGHVDTEYGDIRNIGRGNDWRDWHDGWFDRVMCISVIEHVPDYKKVLTELLRVLKPGGFLLLTMDVVINTAATKDFCIDIPKARELVESFGGVWDYPNQGLLMNRMPNGEILTCLALKIVKE